MCFNCELFWKVFFIKRNLSVFLAKLRRVLTCACADLHEHAWQWLPVSCLWANLICASRTPSAPELYKRRIKDASRPKKKEREREEKNKSGKGYDPLNICVPSLHCANRGYCCLATWSRQSPTVRRRRATQWNRRVIWSFPRPRMSFIVKF